MGMRMVQLSRNFWSKLMKRLALAITLTLCTSLAALGDVQDEIQTFYCPFDKGAAENAVVNLLNSAEKEIWGNAFGLTDPRFVDALIAAKQRGVEVVFTADSTQAAGPHEKPLVVELLKAGCDIQIGKSPVHSQLLHLKAFEIDGKVVEDGSWNFSPSASQQLNVVNIYNSPKRAAELKDVLHKIYDHVAPEGPHASKH